MTLVRQHILATIVAGVAIVLFLGAGTNPTDTSGGGFVFLIIVTVAAWAWWIRRTPPASVETISTSELAIVRAYHAKNVNAANRLFGPDSTTLAAQGYVPITQTWAVGNPGCFRVLTLGLFAWAVRPMGTLTVTYHHR